MSYVEDTRHALALYIEAPSTGMEFEQLKALHPELRSFQGVSSLIDFFRSQGMTSREKNVVLRALLSAYGERPQFVFFMLMLVMLPGLLLIVQFFFDAEQSPDDLWGDVLYQFRLTLEEQAAKKGSCSTARLKWGTFDRLMDQRTLPRRLAGRLRGLHNELLALHQSSEALAERHLRDILSQQKGEELSVQDASLVLRSWIANHRITPQRAHLLFQLFAEGRPSAEVGRIVGASDAAIRQRKARLQEELSQDPYLQALLHDITQEEEP